MTPTLSARIRALRERATDWPVKVCEFDRDAGAYALKRELFMRSGGTDYLFAEVLYPPTRSGTVGADGRLANAEMIALLFNNLDPILAALEREEARADVSALAKRVTDDVLSHPTIRKIDLDAFEWSGAVSVFDIIHVALKTVAAPPTPDRALVEALWNECRLGRAMTLSGRNVAALMDARTATDRAARLATDAEKGK